MTFLFLLSFATSTIYILVGFYQLIYVLIFKPTGRGLPPRWLKDLVSSGHAKEEYLIDKPQPELPAVAE